MLLLLFWGLLIYSNPSPLKKDCFLFIFLNIKSLVLESVSYEPKSSVGTQIWDFSLHGILI